MKKLIITLIISVVSMNIYSQNDSILKYTLNKENIVASAIDGTWKSKKRSQEITVYKDTSILNLIPKKYYKFLYKKAIYHAGYITLGNKDEKQQYPFLLIELNGNPHLVFFRKRNNEPYCDAESFNLFIARGEKKSEDKLFVGGDFNNQPFFEFVRVQ
ncbi:hypothetical protein [uncultured Tenacibaculum sp.]|uniref:hypothetical protein n=1 Tax=uncultured Tenacibaculum sp. TaxID=174713 RepID=UPI002625D962|nr:hypothetical protein [uncultured Tenacibaculum sp.]